MLYSLPTPFTFISLPYLIVGLILEAVIFWLFMRKYNQHFLKVTFTVLIANAITAFVGLFVIFGTSFVTNLYWFFAIFVINIILETSFYLAYYAKIQVSKLRVLLAASLGNIMTFVVIAYGIFINTALTQKYLHLLGVQLI